MKVTTVSKLSDSHTHASKLTGQQLVLAKQSYVTRNISIKDIQYLVTSNTPPMPGDLILARIDRLGQHKRLELPDGRRAHLFINDEIIISYGNRYAPDQFLGEIPTTLEQCSLVAAGGVASKVISKHANMKAPTKITPLGYLASYNKKTINLNQYSLPGSTSKSQSSKPLILAVTGSSMNGGKTTTMAFLARGLIKAGMTVGAAKVTGTGAGLDSWKMKDAGAYPVIDFTDMGFVSTYKLPTPAIELLMEKQVHHLTHHGVSIILLEVADGLIQTETAALLQSKLFQTLVDGVLFASSEALSAHSAIDWMQSKNIPLIGISGALTASPMVLEETKKISSIPIFTKEELDSPDIYDKLNKLINKLHPQLLNSQ